METAGHTIKGRDLPGAVKVIPEGLKEMISIRESHEFKMKETSSCILGSLGSGSNAGGSLDLPILGSSPRKSKETKTVSSVEDQMRFNEAMATKSAGIYKSFQPLPPTAAHGLKICQENLKSTLQSAISDLETDLCLGVNNNNNNGGGLQQQQQEESLPELAPLSLSKGQQQSLVSEESVAILNSISGSLETTHQFHEERRQEQQMLSTNESGDFGSLKRRNPRLMYTDSSFYNPKHHPSVAEQVEMAHRLSSSLYEAGNRSSIGQDMFLRRAQKSGHWVTTDSLLGEADLSGVDKENLSTGRPHDVIPNLKLVMNPEGKLREYEDLDPEERPPSNPHTPEIALSVVKNLENCKGRGGELFAKRRKKADDWIVDEEKREPPIDPSTLNHVASTEAKAMPSMEKKRLVEAFEDEQRMKADRSMEFRRASSNLEGLSNPSTMPPILCTETSNPYMQNMNWSIHNAQGIDVWSSPAPKSWASFVERAHQYKSQPNAAFDRPLAKKQQQQPPQQQQPLPQTQPKPTPKQSEAQPTQQLCPAPKNETMDSEAKREATMAAFQSQQTQMSTMNKESTKEVLSMVKQESTRSEQQQQQQLLSNSAHSSILESRDFGPGVADLERSKREEYELWFRNQEAIQEKLEYDCLVKYSEDHGEAQQQQQQQKGLSSNGEIRALGNPPFLSSSGNGLTPEQLNSVYEEVIQDRSQATSKMSSNMTTSSSKQIRTSTMSSSSSASFGNTAVQGLQGYETQPRSNQQPLTDFKSFDNQKISNQSTSGEYKSFENQSIGSQFAGLASQQTSGDYRGFENQSTGSQFAGLANQQTSGDYKSNQQAATDLKSYETQSTGSQFASLASHIAPADYKSYENQKTSCQIASTDLKSNETQSIGSQFASLASHIAPADYKSYDNQNTSCQIASTDSKSNETQSTGSQFASLASHLAPTDYNSEGSKQSDYRGFEGQNSGGQFACLASHQAPGNYTGFEDHNKGQMSSTSAILADNQGFSGSMSTGHSFESALNPSCDQQAPQSDFGFSAAPPPPAVPPPVPVKPAESPVEAVLKHRRSESKGRVRSSSRDRPGSQSKVDLFNGFDQAKEPCMDYEKRSVRFLVDRFSKTKPGSLPSQYLPQQYSKNFEPPLNYLSEASSKPPMTSSVPAKKKPTEDTTSKEDTKAEEAYNAGKPRASVLEFLLMDESEGADMSRSGASSAVVALDGQEGSDSLLSIEKDPSALLDMGGLDDGPRIRASKLAIEENPFSEEVNKWDNHNTIARGWESASANYVPVTFRRKYHVLPGGSGMGSSKQASMEPTPQEEEEEGTAEQ